MTEEAVKAVEDKVISGKREEKVQHEGMIPHFRLHWKNKLLSLKNIESRLYSKKKGSVCSVHLNVLRPLTSAPKNPRKI